MKPFQTRETWSLVKPAVTSSRGLVSTQHYLASEAGASVLRSGGNAVDAAVAAGLALGVVEPWMSGIGGGGFMQVHDAESGAVNGIDFAMMSPAGLESTDYPLAEGLNTADKFNWPSVLEDRHTTGPYSIAVPGYLRGAQAALSKFGTMSWQDVMQPALELVRFGLPLDWFATQKITNSARDLRRFDASARMFLPDGLPPVGPISGEITGLPWGRLVDTYERLASAGADDLYTGELAVQLDLDAKEVGSSLRATDLADYAAEAFASEPVTYRGAKIWAPQGLSAGPTLERALASLESSQFGDDISGQSHYRAIADALLEAYAYRLAEMGVGSGSGNTSHLGVVDQAGNVVTWTQTVMSAFGSKVVMPRTGITMNNGIMWFDPIPDRSNSIRPGVRPLSNMCPTLIELENGDRLALGACGGRRIFPAVFQLISFLVDGGMSVEAAMATPRIDVSGTEEVTADNRLAPNILDALSGAYRLKIAQHGVYPNQFALPNVVGRQGDEFVGSAFVASPTAAVVAA